MEGGAAVESALSLADDVPCVPVKVCPIGWSLALSTAAAVVKNCPPPLSLSVSLFPTSSSLHINNCLGIIDHMC